MVIVISMTDPAHPMFGFRIDPEVRRQLRMWCLQHDIPVAEVVRGLIEILLDEGDELGARLRERATESK